MNAVSWEGKVTCGGAAGELLVMARDDWGLGGDGHLADQQEALHHLFRADLHLVHRQPLNKQATLRPRQSSVTARERRAGQIRGYTKGKGYLSQPTTYWQLAKGRDHFAGVRIGFFVPATNVSPRYSKERNYA